MLAKFSVQGFKNFKDKITLDLTQKKNYEFNDNLTKNNLIKNGVIFGKNSSGKSNLGLAIFDIVNNLTDKEKTILDVIPYINLDLKTPLAKFYYQFYFDCDVVEYSYSKSEPDILSEEELIINNETVLYYNYATRECICRLEGAENVNTTLDTARLSFVKYISSNTVLNDSRNNRLFKRFLSFVDNMLMFYALRQNRYFGYMQGDQPLSDVIVKKEKLADFEAFLNRLEIDCRLKAREVDGKFEIYNTFANGESNFFRTASTGTEALALFFYWLINSDNTTFIYMDEFDAYYHFELSEEVVKEIIKQKPDAQILFTSHNTNLMTNELFRPDCLFIMQNNGIKSMSDLTQKELRQAHNLQKMYKAGAFNE